MFEIRIAHENSFFPARFDPAVVQLAGDKNTMNEEKPNRKRRIRKTNQSIDPSRIDDVDFALFIAEEENAREKNPNQKLCAPIFSTYIEARKETAGAAGLVDLHDFHEDDVVTLWDVYICVDSKYIRMGWFTDRKIALHAADTVRLIWERNIKNFLQRQLRIP